MGWVRKLGFGVVAAGLAGGLVWAMWPQPVAVDLGVVTRGPMQGSVSAEGIALVREPYTVTATIAGSAARMPVHVGDAVLRGQSVVAIIRPADPALLDARSRLQAEAALTEAEAAVRLAEANLARAQDALAHAAVQLDRNRVLAERGAIPGRTLEDTVQAHRSAVIAVAAAQSEVELALAARDRMRAQLVAPAPRSDGNGAAPDSCCVQILAPQDGTVLEVAEPSARPVVPGTPLLVIGDLADLEVEVELLSSDAVRLAPGARAEISRWGGEGVLAAEVRRVDPAAFTRVSALGIEEQRVRVRLALLDPPEARPGLGDRYRVFARLILWEAEEVVQLPQSALFRSSGDWAVFVEAEGRAVLRGLRIGRQADGRAEVLGGLDPGDRVVLFPPSTLADGMAIAARTP